MLVLLSPAKRMRFEQDIPENKKRIPQFHDSALPLVNKLARMSKPQLMKLMSISNDLARENQERYRTFAPDGRSGTLAQAIYAFNGEVYWGLDSDTLSAAELKFADKHLRVISGMYGYLKPLDAIQPYRLEMGSSLSVGRKKNLYEYWKEMLHDAIEEDLKKLKSDSIINLASKEYFKAVETAKPDACVINISFKEYRNEKLRSIQFNLKRARGYLARFVIENKITDPELIKGFDTDGYTFAEDMSTDQDWLFIK